MKKIAILTVAISLAYAVFGGMATHAATTAVAKQIAARQAAIEAATE